MKPGFSCRVTEMSSYWNFFLIQSTDWWRLFILKTISSYWICRDRESRVNEGQPVSYETCMSCCHPSISFYWKGDIFSTEKFSGNLKVADTAKFWQEILAKWYPAGLLIILPVFMLCPPNLRFVSFNDTLGIWKQILQL